MSPLVLHVQIEVVDVTYLNARCNPLPTISFISQEETKDISVKGVSTIIGGKPLLCERHTYLGDCYFCDGCNGGWHRP